MTPDPSLADALTAATEAGNVTGKLMWLAAQITSPEMCYLPDGFALIDMAAASSPSEVLAVERKLAAKFGKDWKVSTFRSNVKEAKSRLTIPANTDTPLITSTAGVPKPLLANAIVKLSGCLSLGYDTFSNKAIHQSPSPWGTAGPWGDIDDISAANYLQHADISVTSGTAAEAAIYIASQKPYHPVRDWLTSLKWDGEERLDNLFSYYFGCPINKWVCDVSRMWMISAVARIMRPGCIAKYMVVLEGQQDKGKSRGLRALVNGHLDGDCGVQWFRDNMPPIDHKDIGIYMQGVWIIEVAELSSVKRAQWENIKSFISSPRDSFRKSYGRHLQDYPRQCVFAGTTNEDRWGGDQTGLTRFWPMRTGNIITDAPDGKPSLLRDRPQLWAEAVHLFNEGSPWWGDEDFAELARAEQDQRVPDVTVHREEIVAALLKISGEIGFDGWVNVGQILSATSIPVSGHERLKRDVGAILRQEGWKHGSHRFNGGNAHPSQGFRKEEE